jgi:hypothetical protein
MQRVITQSSLANGLQQAVYLGAYLDDDGSIVTFLASLCMLGRRLLISVWSRIIAEYLGQAICTDYSCLLMCG